MLPQSSIEELHNAQNRDDKLQPLIWYLQDGTLPKDAPTAEKILWQEGQYFLSDNNILYRQLHTGKQAVIQLVVLKPYKRSSYTGAMTTSLVATLVWTKHTNVSDPHTFGTICLQTSNNGSNPAVLVPRRKGMFTIAVSGPWKVIVADYWASSCHELRKLIRSYYRRPLYKVHRNCCLALNRSHHNHSGVFGQNCFSTWPTSQILDWPWN